MSTLTFSEWLKDMDTPIPALWWRNIFTTAFITCNSVIIFLGGRLIKRQAQRQIVKNESVSVTHMTPWFSLGPTLSYMRQFRKLPGGIIGLLMIASGIFAILDNYIVNSYIYEQSTRTTCSFKHGLVTYFGDSAPSKPANPIALWPLSFLAERASLFANFQHGIQGVYSKVDYNFNKENTKFSPTEDDVLGNWNCSEQYNITFLQKDLTSGDTLNAAILRQNFLYPQSNDNTAGLRNNIPNDIMYWSADQDDKNTSPVWNMNATIGRNVSETLQATNYHCKYVAKRKWNPPIMKLQDALTAWKDLMLHYVIDPHIDFSNFYIEVMLNTMSMVAASGNSAFYANDIKKLSSRDKFYGCIKTHSVIQPPVWAVLFILIALIVGLGVIDLYNLIMNKLSGRANIVDKMPFGVIEWQLATIQNLTGNEKLEYKDMKDYEYLHDRSTANYTARKRLESGIPHYQAVNTTEVSSTNTLR